MGTSTSYAENELPTYVYLALAFVLFFFLVLQEARVRRGARGDLSICCLFVCSNDGGNGIWEMGMGMEMGMKVYNFFLF